MVRPLGQATLALTLGPRLRPKFFHTGNPQPARPNQFRPAWDIEGYRRSMPSWPDVPCRDCGTLVTPGQFGPLPSRCEVCKAEATKNRRRAPQRPDVPCQRCGESITPPRKGAAPKWCADCATEVHREQQRARRGTPTSWTCQDCDKTFEREYLRGTVPKRCPECMKEERRLAQLRSYANDPEHAQARSRKWREQNLEQAREATRRYMAKQRRENPEAARRAKLRSTYKLTDEELDAVFERAKGACEACGILFGDDQATKPVIDHDHDTGVVRGVLCANCNSGIGMMGDDPERLRQAAAFIERAGQ
mgnify:CR=1 FL=1